MAKITITFQEEGDQPVAFEIPAEVTSRIEQYIAELNASTVLGIQPYAGKADWFGREAYAKILKPVIDRFPFPPPQEAQNKLQQAEQLRQEAEQIIAQSAVKPIQLVNPPQN